MKRINIIFMKNKLILLSLIAMPLLYSCEDNTLNDVKNDLSKKNKDGTPCTLEARAAITVKVTVEGATLTDQITVKVIDADYVEKLISIDNFIYSGAYEREGNYIVSVNAYGYKEFVSESIAITSDECHVIGKTLEVDLLKD